MKKLLSLLLTILISNSIFGQSFHNNRVNERTAQSFLDSLVYQNYDTMAHQWVYNQKISYLYSSGVINKPTSGIIYSWNKVAAKWVNANKLTDSYDSNNNDTLEIQYNWDTTAHQWNAAYKYVNSYDVNNNNTLQISYNWNTLSNQWVASFKTSYFYDANNNDTTNIQYNWSSSQWVNSSKYNYYYNTNNKDTLKLNYQWNSISNQWNLKSKTTYLYDTNNNDTLEVSYNWNTPPGNWLLSGKTKHVYDVNNLQVQDINYSYKNNNWIYKSRATYYWSSEAPTSTGGIIIQNNINVFPNPTSESITVSVNQNTPVNFVLLDTEGNQVVSKLINNTAQIEIENLPRGFYIYKIVDHTNCLKTGGLIVH